MQIYGFCHIYDQVKNSDLLEDKTCFRHMLTEIHVNLLFHTKNF